MTIQLSYRRLGFFTAVCTAGWLVNLLALQLPLLMPLLLGNISALLLTLRLRTTVGAAVTAAAVMAGGRHSAIG